MNKMDMYIPDVFQISCAFVGFIVCLLQISTHCYQVDSITLTKKGSRRYIAFYFMDFLKIKLYMLILNLLYVMLYFLCI